MAEEHLDTFGEISLNVMGGPCKSSRPLTIKVSLGLVDYFIIPTKIMMVFSVQDH